MLHIGTVKHLAKNPAGTDAYGHTQEAVVQPHSFLTLAVGRGQWSVTCPGQVPCVKIILSTH